MIDKKTMEAIIKELEKEYGIVKIEKSPAFPELIRTVLSQRSQDSVTEKVADRLLRRALTAKALADLSQKEIAKIIKPVNFYRTKAKRISQIAEIIAKNKGKVPKSREKLMELPGVGPKTADIIMAYSYGEEVIAIDTHVEVISKRLGIAEEKDSYDQIQRKLDKVVPKARKMQVNQLFVGHGKKICKKHMPGCSKCTIRRFCRYYRKVYLKDSKMQ